MDSTFKGRFPNLNQPKSKQVLSFYHDCMLRVFDNHASRKSEYLGNVLLSTAKSGDVTKLCKALEKVDVTKVEFNLRERDTESTPLMVAAKHGHDQIIQILLSCGSDATLKNAAGQTILENAPRKITELILDSVNRQGAGQPLLCQAAWQGNATVVKKLLYLNPNLNVNSKNSEGLTPLLLVTRDLDFFRSIERNFFTENYNPAEVVSLLLHQNADCTIVDNDGRSALHLTARNHGTNARNIISLLARKDSLNVDLRDRQDYSALHCASETGDPDVMLALIDNGANVNAKGPFGRTPLHTTASRGDEKTSEILVEHGANVFLLDDLGFTPLDVAKGNNVLVLLKEAWTEHSQRSVDSMRIKSAPVTLPVKLDHLDAPDMTDLKPKDDGNGISLKNSSKKHSEKIRDRSHSEDETRPPSSSGLPTRTRSYSSGPSPRSRLHPMNEEILPSLSDDGRVSPTTQKTILTRTNPSDSNLRPIKSPQTETIPRPIAKVAVLNIDLKGHDLHKRKSKSCSELPFTRFRVQKLSAPRACSTEIEPLNNPLSLRGRSVSAVSLSSFETLPGILSEAMHDRDEADGVEKDERPLLEPSHELEIVITPPANGDNSVSDDRSPSPDTDILNKTFNCKEKSVFKFPSVTNAELNTNFNPMAQNSSRGFFVDWNQLETPLQKCTKCREDFKSEDLKSGTSICNSCYKDSIAKDTFWVPFGSSDRKSKTGVPTGHRYESSAGSNDRNTQSAMRTDERHILTETRTWSVDDTTICIDKETLNILPKKKLSLGGLGSEYCSQNSEDVENLSKQRTKQTLKKTVSDTSEIEKSYRRTESANPDRENCEDSTTGTRDSFVKACLHRRRSERSTSELCNKVCEMASEAREQHEDSTTDSRKTLTRDDSFNKATSEQRNEECGGPVREEADRFDASFLKDEERESHQRLSPQNVSDNNDKYSNQYDTELINGLSSEADSNKLDLPVRKNLIEKSVGVNIANAECRNGPHRKSFVLSCKQLEESNKLLQRFVADIKCVEKGNLSAGVVARLSNQSATGKGSFVGQSGQETVELDNPLATAKGSLVDQSAMEKVEFGNQSTNGKGSLVGQSAMEKVKFGNQSTNGKGSVVDQSAMEKVKFRNQSTNGKGSLVGQSTMEKVEFGNQSTNEKGSLVDQSTMEKVEFNESTTEKGSSFQTDHKNVENIARSGDDGAKTGCNGIEKDKTSDVVMDNRDCFGLEHTNADVTPHQVVIVNPFPSPVPPKVPVVNVSSNCQCDRFASFAKNSGTAGRKKGRGKKIGVKPNSSGKKTSIVGKGKITSGQKEVSNVASKTKPSMRVVSAGKKSKKKVKTAQNEVLKEVSVIQPNLREDLIEEISPIATTPNTSEDILRTGIVSAPVRQATFVKEKFTALSPIPEGSRSGSSVQDSCSDIFRTHSENIDDFSSMKESNAPSVTGQIGANLPSDLGCQDNPATLNVAPRLSRNDIDDSRPRSSDPNGRTSEMNDNLEELIQEILDETDELEKHHAKSHVSSNSNTDELDEITEDENTNFNTHAVQTVSNANSKSNASISYQSKEELVTSWLLEQNDEIQHQILQNTLEHRDLSDFARALPSDTTATDVSRRSSGLTLKGERAEISPESSAFSEDTTSANGSNRGNKSVINSFSQKTTISGTHSENFTTGSISLPAMSGMSVVSGVSRNSKELVHSRLSGRKSETSGTGSELTSSEEEEIVWRKGNMLGKGAFGKVYCGLTNAGQMIAVKQVELITSNMEQAERQYEKLQEEVALLKSLRHENVVSYLGTCLDGGVVNIFMQFVPGGSIASILARFGPLEERVFRYYTKQILVGVEYLHRNNVVHRDIKGGNIMLMPTGVIKLIDFGCAKRLCMNMSQSREDLLRSMKGTPYWMAPEVITETGYGRKSDIWSIGCTVFEMATGKPPWSNLPPMSAILAIGQGSEPPKLERPNSDDACNFVTVSMVRDPDERLSAEELLRHPFILQCDDQR